LSFFKVRLAALDALPVNDDAGTVAVRAEDPIVEIKGFILVGGWLRLFPERSTALHAIATFRRDLGSTGRAGFSGDFLMTVRAFHDDQLFLEVLT
jgi:hypothetical protein